MMNNLLLRLRRPLMFLPPAALWLFLFRDFFTKKALVVEDTFAVYAVAKFYLDNLLAGVFPSWNPYVLWGMAHVRQIGEFNPIWFVTPLLNAVGLDFYRSFICTLVIYFFAGVYGFYLLARAVLKDELLAYWAGLLILFSSLGMTMFIQPTILMLFVPAVWFAFFFVRFAGRPTPAVFLLMTFFLAQVLMAYIPFYFLIAAAAAVLLYAVIYFKEFVALLQQTGRFALAHPWLCVLGGVALGLACLSQILTWLTLRDGFIPLARPALMTFADVKDSGLAAGEFLRNASPFGLLLAASGVKAFKYSGVFFNLRDLSFYDQRLFYVPLMGHVIFYLSLWTSWRRRELYFLSLTVGVFLILLGPATPIYEFLFEKIVFFKMFRNLFLLLIFLMAFYVLFLAAQAEGVFARIAGRGRGRWWGLAGVWVSHAALLIWMSGQANVLLSSYVTVAASLVFFTVYPLRAFSARPGLVLVCLGVLTVCQPVEVARNYVAAAGEVRPPIVAQSAAVPRVRPRFAYLRPEWTPADRQALDDSAIYQLFCSYFIAQRDAAGFVAKNLGYATTWSQRLFARLGMDGLSQYSRYKFILYDRTQAVRDQDINLVQVARDLNGLQDMAYLSIDPPGQAAVGPALLTAANPPAQAEPVWADRDDFRVVDFSVNGITVQTNFSRPRFLVYNDSYHPRWRVTINGKPQPLYRANIAFKGVLVPAGAAEVSFYYRTLGGQAFPFFLLAFFPGLFLAGIIQLWRQRTTACLT